MRENAPLAERPKRGRPSRSTPQTQLKLPELTKEEDAGNQIITNEARENSNRPGY